MEETYNKWPEWQKVYVDIKLLTPRGCLNPLPPPTAPPPPEQTFVSPAHGGSIWNLASIGPAVLEKKMFENLKMVDDDGLRSLPIL